MKIAKRILLGILWAGMLLSVILGGAACGRKNTEDGKISYTITVTCEDEAVLAGVRVQPFLNGTQAAEAKSLNSEHKAAFELKPETYTVTVSGAESYTYPQTTVTAENPNATVRLTKSIVSYAVAYAFGGYNDTDYAGSSTLPTETDKAEGAKFDLAEAPVWSGYTFDGWSDGENVYEADEEYVMPAHAVTFTARWLNVPDGVITYKNIEVPVWAQDATTGGYTIEKGQFVQLSATFSGKGTEGSDWVGIASKIYKNGDYSTVGTFYQFRPDFAVDRRNWDNWREDNQDFDVVDTNWNEEKYVSLVTRADVVITVALSENGVLTYTIELVSENYSYKRVFSPKNTTMDSALVIFGADGCTASDATIVCTMPDGVKLSFDWGYGDLVDLKVAERNSTYTLEEDAVRDGYLFLGWQVNGAGAYYKSGDTYSVGGKRVRFIAAWEEDGATPGLAFTELADGNYSVKKGTANAETVIIPRTYHNKPVTEIGSMAFESAKWLKHIVLPDTITAINGRAFHSSGLEEIVIPANVKVIAASTFYNCASLTGVTLPSGLINIQTDAFAKCTALQFNEAGGALYLGNEQKPYLALIKAKNTSITACNIQSGCEIIYDQAFNQCASLAEVTFPATLRIIGGKTFMGCKSLSSLVIPDNVTGIGGFAFNGCSGLQSITLPFIGGGDQAGGNSYPFGYIFGTGSYTGGTKTSQEYPATGGGYTTSFYYIPTELTSVTVTGENIPYGAFKNCSNITTIRLSANVKTIANNAFNGCSALTDVYYNGTQADWQKVSVTTTGNDPFKNAAIHYKED